MRLKSGYDAMSDVPAGFESAFHDKDGKAVFVGGEFEFKTEAEYDKVLSAKQEGFNKYHQANDRLKAFEGIDPDGYKTLIEELDVLRAKAKDGGTDEETIAAIVNARVERATEELTGTNGKLTEEIGELRGFKLKTQKKTVLSEVIGKNVSKDARVDAHIIIGQAIERQADGSYMSNGSNGFEKGLSIEQLVAKALESRPHWNKQSTSGHGSGGSSGGAGGLNETQQLKKLLKRAQKGEQLTMSEKRTMSTLANKLHEEQTGG